MTASFSHVFQAVLILPLLQLIRKEVRKWDGNQEPRMQITQYLLGKGPKHGWTAWN